MIRLNGFPNGQVPLSKTITKGLNHNPLRVCGGMALCFNLTMSVFSVNSLDEDIEVLLNKFLNFTGQKS